MKVVVTGSPATGKTSVAIALAKLLNCPCVSANKIAFEIGAAKKIKEEKEFVVDLKKLQNALSVIFRKQKTIVAEGHLLCEFSLPADVVVVLRCDPRVLLKRYAQRGYSRRKAIANVLVEVLDYALLESEENYGKSKIVQIVITKKTSFSKILEKVRKKQSDFVDWSGLLLKPPLASLAAA